MRKLFERHIGGMIFFAVAIAIIVIVGFTTEPKNKYIDEAIVLKYYIPKFSDPEELQILAMDKYTVSDEQTYYYLKVFYPPVDETQSYELLLILNHTSRRVKMAHLNDLKLGYFDEINVVWEEIKQNEPDVSFSQEVINEIREEIIGK